MDDPECEIALEEVQKILPNARLGDIVSKEIKPKNFGRIAAQTARQVVIQGVREAERNMIYDRFKGLKGEILFGTITRVDNRYGVVYVRVQHNGMATDAQLLPVDQREDETYAVDQRLQVYIADVKQGTRHGTQILASRTHAALVRRLFEQEVPEIHDGTVIIDSIAREAGKRTKIAVHSQNPEVDPIGACVGTSGARVNAIVEQLRGEKMDIIQYSEDPGQYSAAALSPPTSSAWRPTPRRRPAGWWCPTTSCPWPLARWARTPGWPPSSPAIKSTSRASLPPRQSLWRAKRRPGRRRIFPL